MFLCAICLRTRQPEAAGDAVTIANGNALCAEHYQELVDWQNEVHGPLSIEALLRVMHAETDVPAPPWAT